MFVIRVYISPETVSPLEEINPPRFSVENICDCEEIRLMVFFADAFVEFIEALVTLGDDIVKNV